MCSALRRFVAAWAKHHIAADLQCNKSCSGLQWLQQDTVQIRMIKSEGNFASDEVTQGQPFLCTSFCLERCQQSSDEDD
jgi:hypothetical protein